MLECAKQTLPRSKKTRSTLSPRDSSIAWQKVESPFPESQSTCVRSHLREESRFLSWKEVKCQVFQTRKDSSPIMSASREMASAEGSRMMLKRRSRTNVMTDRHFKVFYPYFCLSFSRQYDFCKRTSLYVVFSILLKGTRNNICISRTARISFKCSKSNGIIWHNAILARNTFY